MELIKDIIKALLEGIIEYKAENKLSERRKEYFGHRKGKGPKNLFCPISDTRVNICGRRAVPGHSEKSDRHILVVCRYRNRSVHGS